MNKVNLSVWFSFCILRRTRNSLNGLFVAQVVVIWKEKHHQTLSWLLMRKMNSISRAKYEPKDMILWQKLLESGRVNYYSKTYNGLNLRKCILIRMCLCGMNVSLMKNSFVGLFRFLGGVFFAFIIMYSVDKMTDHFELMDSGSCWIGVSTLATFSPTWLGFLPSFLEK